MFSAVNKKGKMRFMIESKRLNARVFCRFLHRLMIGSRRKVFLIIDGHPMHKSGIVKRKVESYEGQLRLFLLPPYSPELNPDEGVWRVVKSGHLGRAGFISFNEMKSRTVGALRSLAKNPSKIRSLFQTETTSYAA
jgi:transposase